MTEANGKQHKLRGKAKRTKSLEPKKPKIVTRELHDSDDPSDEEVLAKIGNVPMKWYEHYKHLGYDTEANKIVKEQQDNKLDTLIRSHEDPNWWRTVKDELNNTGVVLTDEQLNLLERIKSGKAAQPVNYDDFQVEFDFPDRIHPIDNSYPSKQSFLPSKWERMKINKMVNAIRMGWMKPKQPKKPEDELDEKLWDIWENEEENEVSKKLPPVISAPKMKLPTHAESYNPSEEYLFDEEEKKQWLAQEPEDRELNFIPKKYDALRKVEAYEGLIRERFERCLDLYLAPRIRKKKLDIDPESLIPNLPRPSELRPFPTTANITYEAHEYPVLAIDVDEAGNYLVSLDKGGNVIIWDVRTSKIVERFSLEGDVYDVAWSKGIDSSFIVICHETHAHIQSTTALSRKITKANINKLSECEESYKTLDPSLKLLEWKFHKEGDELFEKGIRLSIDTLNQVKFVTFHTKGDFFATVSPNTLKSSDQVFVHSLSKGASTRPFAKSKGNIQKVEFHPSKPLFFIMTLQSVYIYNLQKQVLVKRLKAGAVINSCISVHPKGDNLLVGTSDKRVFWFDLDLGDKAYKTMKYHTKVVRKVIFHPRYPLFATCSDDGCVNIFHGMVYNDLMQNALIVPLKILKKHKITDGFGVYNIAFHPHQPWIFSAGADGQVILWT